MRVLVKLYMCTVIEVFGLYTVMESPEMHGTLNAWKH